MSIECQSEENESGRVADELCCKYDITTSQNELPRSVGQKYLKSKYKENIVFYQNKVMHGYIAKLMENDPMENDSFCESVIIFIKKVTGLSHRQK